MSKLIEIQNQIQKLQQQEIEIRTKEFDSTVQDILAKMASFGITVKDLQLKHKPKRRKGIKNMPTPGKVVRARQNKIAGKKVAPKYRGPNGETWSGRGLAPRWLSMLTASGKSKADFAV